tara:strand:- start:2626 stop:3393 length:768 start_codon:yes stop_codon:yes gene_type:complete
MICKRIIARLDVKGPDLVKGVHLEGLRIIGNPQNYANKYEKQGADEIIFIDSVASLYGRNNLTNIVKHTAKKIFIPLTVGGGIRSIENIRKLLNCGADKVAINTAAINNPQLIKKAAKCFGNQCIVVSIDAKKIAENKWEAYTENARQKTGKDVIEWIKDAVKLGAGEILLTSIDKEGTMKGFDMELINEAEKVCQVPLIVGGGAGKTEDIEQALEKNVDAVAIAATLHYNKSDISKIKEELYCKINVRNGNSNS